MNSTEARAISLIGAVGWPAAVALLGPRLLEDYWLSVGVGIACFGMAAVGMTLVFRLGGMLSLVQATFVGVGMYGVAKSPWGGFGSIVYASLVGVVLSLVVGVLVVRLRHLYFALGTLAAGLVLEGLARGYPEELGGPSGLVVTVAPPLDLATPGEWFVTTWLLVGLSLISARLLWRSRFGRAAQVLGHNPELAAAVGVQPWTARLRLFVLASVLATVGGAVYAHFLFFVSPPALGVTNNLQVVVATALGGSSAAASVVGIAIVRLVPELGAGAASSQLVILGVVLGGLVLLFPEGLKIPKLRGRGVVSTNDVAPSRLEVVATKPQGDASLPALDAHDIRVSFGGLHALVGVSIQLHRGRVTGLIGPNGAGKTTLFNALSGAIRPNAGSVIFKGTDVTRWQPHRRASHGLARTFQLPRAVPHASVLETVIIGTHRLGSSGVVRGMFGLELSERKRLDRVARAALERVGLTDVADDPADSLGTGRRKLLEVARALALEPTVLLLDEPAGGLEALESERLGRLVRTLADEGMAVLLIEHGMDLVMACCDHVAVMEMGRIIAHDAPSAVRDDPEVIRAYLG